MPTVDDEVRLPAMIADMNNAMAEDANPDMSWASAESLMDDMNWATEQSAINPEGPHAEWYETSGYMDSSSYGAYPSSSGAWTPYASEVAFPGESSQRPVRRRKLGHHPESAQLSTQAMLARSPVASSYLSPWTQQPQPRVSMQPLHSLQNVRGRGAPAPTFSREPPSQLGYAMFPPHTAVSRMSEGYASALPPIAPPSAAFDNQYGFGEPKHVQQRQGLPAAMAHRGMDTTAIDPRLLFSQGMGGDGMDWGF
jgi:hypothetical protein